ncbi:response regulator [Granulicella sp. S190]|uniref:response regulator n=1 Tax=Granulicella sp. S190 TaxID=1747226 RepID=UPI00131E915B|nr:response regulator [Granulicella sp. S190]
MKTRIRYEVVPIAEVPSEDAVAIPEKNRPVVLIVDDERIIADTLSTILSRSGFSTLTAYDGIAGLEIAHSAAPDLIISDVVMPGMTGVELAITVTQTIPTCKILLFSGQAATVDLLEEARSAGHNFTTLSKPVHPTDMLKRVSECLAIQTTTLPPARTTASSTQAVIYSIN